VGTLVYRAYPRNIGVVRSVVGNTASVEFPDGRVVRDVYWVLTPIDDLIDDHAKKLGTHLRNRAAAAAALGLPGREFPVVG